jgi:hypothetical protein
VRVVTLCQKKHGTYRFCSLGKPANAPTLALVIWLWLIILLQYVCVCVCVCLLAKFSPIERTKLQPQQQGKDRKGLTLTAAAH